MSIACLNSEDATEKISTSGSSSSIVTCPLNSTLFAILILAVVISLSTMLPEQISTRSEAFIFPLTDPHTTIEEACILSTLQVAFLAISSSPVGATIFPENFPVITSLSLNSSVPSNSVSEPKIVIFFFTASQFPHYLAQ